MTDNRKITADMLEKVHFGAGIHNTLKYARLHQENVVGHISYTDGN